MKSETVPVRKLAVAGIVSLLLLAGCGGGTSPSSINQPTSSGPTITTLSPNSTVAGGAAFTLTINGTNFVAASMVNFGGSTPATTFVNSTQLTAAIPAASIASTGTLAVTVTDPASGGGTSKAINFTITSGATPPAGDDPQSIAVDSAGNFAYVENASCSSGLGCVSIYAVNPTTGALESMGPQVSSLDYGGESVSVDPSGKFAYVANGGDDFSSDGSVVSYTINATTGALTSTGSIMGNCPGLCVPESVAVDPSGKFAYVPNGGGESNGVAMYTINATTGALTSTGMIPVGGFAVSVAVHPSGKFAYAANGNNTPGLAGNVSMYTINATTGALTSIGTVAAGTIFGEPNPIAMAVDPTGSFAYVANSGSNDVSMYSINTTTGILTPVGLIVAGTTPLSVAVDPTGKFAYVTNSGSNDVSMYTINATTGALTSIGTIAAGSTPASIAIHPSGKFAYVTNSASNDVSIYSIDAATGALTLIGTIGT
jgi:YVTN family beta-propeller protein